VEARLVGWLRRDHEKAARVPVELAVEMGRESALGEAAWLEAMAAADFGRFRDALSRQVELRHRYAACFPEAADPYDVLLDDYEPGLTTAEIVPLFTHLREELSTLVAAAGDPAQARNDGVFIGSFPIEVQRPVVESVLEIVGFDPETWRLDASAHPFAMSPGRGDHRLTTRFDESDFAMAFYSALHEFGHGLYEASVDPALYRTTLEMPSSLGVHESQSRLWENIVGRGRPFCAWLAPRLREELPGFAYDAASLYRAVNTVQPSAIRVEADETTYNLHIVLRFELELDLMAGRLEVDDLPGAWIDGMRRLLGVEVSSDVEGVLQDIHWAVGAFGYFPTYTLGNLMAAQLWLRLLADVPDLEPAIAAGDFAPLRDWLRDRVHRHGRALWPRELLLRATGEELRVEPFLRYLRGKLEDAGVLAAT